MIIEEGKSSEDVSTEQRWNASQREALSAGLCRKDAQSQVIPMRPERDSGCGLHRSDRTTDAGAWRAEWERGDVDAQESSVAWGEQVPSAPVSTKKAVSAES